MSSLVSSIAFSFTKDPRDKNQRLQHSPDPGRYGVSPTSNKVKGHSPGGKGSSSAMAGGHQKILEQLKQQMSVTVAKMNGSSHVSYPIPTKLQKKQSTRNGQAHKTSKTIIHGGQPGPGQYNVSKDFGADALKVTLHGKSSLGKITLTPGPGQYSAKTTLTTSRQKSPVLHGSSRFKEGRKDTSPGPGMYHRDDFFGKNGLAVSIQPKLNEMARDNSPGPGAYDPTLEAVKQAVRGLNISSSIKPVDDGSSKTAKDWIPGPGAYFNNDLFFGKNAPAFSLKGKLNERLLINLPGPGAYEAQDSQSKSPGFRMSKAPRSSKDRMTQQHVGPGIYEQTHLRVGTEGPKFSMGVKTESKNRNDSPGPGAYEPAHEYVKSKSPAIQVRGKTQLNSSRYDGPGPGAYDQQSLIGKDSPLISIKGRQQSPTKSQIPGPGSYDAVPENVKKRVIAYNLGSGGRNFDGLSPSLNSLTPGPGTYNQGSLMGKDAPQISIRGTLASPAKPTTPGPGEYNPSDSAIKFNPGTVRISGTGMKLRESFTGNGSQTPGPGAYDMTSLIGTDAPQIAIKGRGNDTTRDQSPGPGAYDLSDSLSYLNVSPGFKVGRSKRDYLSTVNSLPGPGSYDPRLMQTSLGISLKSKVDKKFVSDTPGPGSYQPATPSKVKQGNPTYSFGISPDRERIFQRALKQALSLGPGEYEVHNINDQQIIAGKTLIGYSFSKSKSPARDDGSPGPGTYEAQSAFGLHAPRQ